jgi:pimeloyl-ACP methyl ester carboxylesterase
VRELTPAQKEMDARDWTFEGTWPFEPRWLFTEGIRIHYVDEGPRDGEPVVLVHGAPFWSYSFRDEIARLAGEGRRVVAYDQLGFGRSDKPHHENEYSLERDVGHLRALVDDAGIGRAHLIAEGTGVEVARAFAAAAPERVEAVEERPARPQSDLVGAPLIGSLLVKGARWPLRRAELSEEERAAYLAPHPSWPSRAGILVSLRRTA